MAFYRKPGVYLEEGTLTGPGEIGLAAAYGLFVGAAPMGSITDATLVNSWGEYESAYGGWEPTPGVKTNYLPYAVWSFYQNGGRNAWVQRAMSDEKGETATADIFDATAAPNTKTAFVVNARSAGAWGGTSGTPAGSGGTPPAVDPVDGLFVAVHIEYTPVDASSDVVYTLYVYKNQGGGFVTEVERFQNLSPSGQIPGTKRADYAINDERYGSKYIRIADVDPTVSPKESLGTPVRLSGGKDGDPPSASDLAVAADEALGFVDGPVILNIVGYRDPLDAFVSASYDPTSLDRGDVFVINDNFDRRAPGTTSEAYGAAIVGDTSTLGASTGNSYVAAYTPWVTVPDPAVNGGTIVVPPGGSVAGMMARNDVTAGVFQAPAGVQWGGLNSALNVDAKFTDSTLGQLNSLNFNVIRPIPGSGIAVMGARTRKTFAVDKYINARRTLIYIKETLKRSCEFALFQNNDESLWTQLRATAELVLRPIWSQGGLKGANPDQAYRVVCDASVNTPSVIASGEVRMEIGLALQTPAEFIVIRVSQFAGGQQSANEI
jgi:hypothetical protein